MEPQLREILGQELSRRHGYGMMEGKIKPVHIANALLRIEHQLVGRMSDLKHLMIATASRESAEARLDAARRMLERNKERWGRFGEESDLRNSALVTKVLPLLRTLLATDGAAFGKSPEFSSFSSPTASTVTRDPSDEGAGEFIHQLWSGPPRLAVLDLLRDLTAVERELSKVDDLAAVLIPLADGTSPYRRGEVGSVREHGSKPWSDVEIALREAARDLAAYEQCIVPNPMATLQRIVLLASMSLFFHAATRARETAGLPRRVVLLDVSNSRSSTIARASEFLVTAILRDAREYMARILFEALSAPDPSVEGETRAWAADPVATFTDLFRRRCKSTKTMPNMKELVEALEELREANANVEQELTRRVIELIDSSNGRSPDGFIRLLGLRCGLLYPQQKNPQKRFIPMDRALEVLVAATFDLSGRPLEYRDFLDEFYRRWQIVVGGRLEDSRILADEGTPVSSADLTENSTRFLTRLEHLGLARKMADSVAVVGLTEDYDAGC